MNEKLEHSPCGEDQAADRIYASYSQTTIDIVDVMKKLGISEARVPAFIQQIITKYQSIPKS